MANNTTVDNTVTQSKFSKLLWIFGILSALLVLAVLINSRCLVRIQDSANGRPISNWADGIMGVFYKDKCEIDQGRLGSPGGNQKLILQGNQLSISNGNTVTLPDFSDLQQQINKLQLSSANISSGGGAQGPIGPAGANGANGATGPAGPPGPPLPPIVGDLASGTGISFTGSGIGRLVGLGTLTIDNAGVTSNDGFTGAITFSGSSPIVKTSAANNVDFGCPTCVVTGGTLFTTAASAGPSQTISQGDTLSLLAGNGLSTTASAGDNVTFAVNSPTCASGEYLQWSGAAFVCTLTTVSNTSAGNLLDTTVNGVTGASVNIINSNTLISVGNTMTSTVNGVADSDPIINSNVLSWTQLAGLTSTLNGVAASFTPAAGVITNILGYDAGGTPVYESLSTLACDPTGSFFCQNGNSFGVAGVLGTNDAFVLI